MTFFRLFRVPIDGQCPLPSKSSKKKKSKNVLPIADESEGTCGGDWNSGSGPLAASGIFGHSQSSATTAGKSKCEVETVDDQVESKITEKEQNALLQSSYLDSECDDESKPTFWLNFCTDIPIKASEFVNLKLNPEHYTGYNGSRIWNAIYKESCFKGEDPESMCYEQRVLYRLLSGLHASINTHISLYFEKSSKSDDEWEANPERFVQVVGSHPERIDNLHFAFVVLLRAVKKITPFLRNFDYSMGIQGEDEKAHLLVNRLLDSQIMKSCQPVFDAFDESLLFQEQHVPTLHSLKRNFKQIFQDIAKIFNCVKCQRCRLHGKMQLLGIGTALRVLLLPEDLIDLSRDDIVALFNTLGKLSESLEAIPNLISLYWERKLGDTGEPSMIGMNSAEVNLDSISPNEIALKNIREASKVGLLSEEQEDVLVDAVLDYNQELLLLAKSYEFDYAKFVRHGLRRFPVMSDEQYSAIIVGGGLSGLTAALTLLDRGAKVVLVDKESFLGGNSARASSGINGIDDESVIRNDSVEEFTRDVLVGGGRSPNDKNALVETLTEGSVDALQWLRNRCGMPLEHIGQLGGHSHPRTHRPSKGLAGAELISTLLSLLEPYESKGQLVLRKKTKVVRILRNSDSNQTTGVECESSDSDEIFTLHSRHVVLATGGYAYDTSPESILGVNRPDLSSFATSNAKSASGDGIKLVQDLDVKGGTVDLSQVQVHPTGFVDLNDSHANVKKLCAELLRGVGGILLNAAGQRFANELGTRDYLTGKMLEQYPNTKQPAFTLLLNRDAAEKAPVHVPMYAKRKLLYRFDTIEEVAEWSNVTVATLRQTLSEYDSFAETGKPGPFGKTAFPSAPLSSSGPYYVGKVTPVLHYCMGGIKIDENSKVLDENNSIINGLYAIGEATGGLHGKNRLGGNALTECVVFGRRVGQLLPVEAKQHGVAQNSKKNQEMDSLKRISETELQIHNSRQDCWVKIYDFVYDLTEFIDEHPPGPEAIIELCGIDGTDEFEEIHSAELLKPFKVLGKYSATSSV
eukprot:CAMPEP_0184025018 /NCGR_PEP_ID=MMETSP0954-20121128/12508_1 /TAXON_ID=627963 /ORGANISM="Aplanochytrium sp, Strain PBS07" /LENGTH=1028 /DNA_ID=CAMNT_0026308617 /DNA_START=322 /DNA_END=3408 /DNA_ORIENTATION=-